jgi:hypothetical protein
VPRAMSFLLITVVTQHSKAAETLSKAGNRAGNRPYFTQSLSQQVATQAHLS